MNQWAVVTPKAPTVQEGSVARLSFSSRRRSQPNDAVQRWPRFFYVLIVDVSEVKWRVMWTLFKSRVSQNNKRVDTQKRYRKAVRESKKPGN